MASLMSFWYLWVWCVEAAAASESCEYQSVLLDTEYHLVSFGSRWWGARHWSGLHRSGEKKTCNNADFHASWHEIFRWSTEAISCWSGVNYSNVGQFLQWEIQQYILIWSQYLISPSNINFKPLRCFFNHIRKETANITHREEIVFPLYIKMFPNIKGTLLYFPNCPSLSAFPSMGQLKSETYWEAERSKSP